MVNIGDVGRSPRTANHVIELSKDAGARVDYVSYLETEVPKFLLAPNVRLVFANTFLTKLIKKLPSSLFFFLRVFVEIVTFFLVFLLRLRKSYDLVLIQNPYSLPVLLLLPLYKLFSKRTKVVVDMHNFGYSLMATHSPSPTNNPAIKSVVGIVDRSSGLLPRGGISKLRRLLAATYKFFEVFLVLVAADKVLVVSKAMKNVLVSDWKLPGERIEVLYDCPDGSKFRPLSLQEKHDFLSTVREFVPKEGETFLSRCEEGRLVERQSRPILFVISSSWGLDDDFATLVDAIRLYKSEKKSKARPRLFFFFTGSGPRKLELSPILQGLSDESVSVFMGWLSFKDYCSLMGCADFSISIHSSASGVDLPIKILDSFACEVPVLAFNYSSTLAELVENGANGVFYKTANELAGLFAKIAGGKERQKFEFSCKSWTDQWQAALQINPST